MLYIRISFRCLLIVIGVISANSLTSAQKGSNIIKGVITMPSNQSILKKGRTYNKDGTKVMQSNDKLAQPSYNVIVSAHPQTFEPPMVPTANAFVTQKEQTFIPLVLPVTKGSKVYFLNEDEFFHNIYSLTPRARFNIGRRPPGNSYTQVIKKVGVVKLACDIHTHMQGMIWSLDTPYFVRADEQGNYQLSDLPDGTYELQVFHPYVSLKSITVTLANGVISEQHFDLSRP